MPVQAYRLYLRALLKWLQRRTFLLTIETKPQGPWLSPAQACRELPSTFQFQEGRCTIGIQELACFLITAHWNLTDAEHGNMTILCFQETSWHAPPDAVLRGAPSYRDARLVRSRGDFDNEIIRGRIRTRITFQDLGETIERRLLLPEQHTLVAFNLALDESLLLGPHGIVSGERPVSLELRFQQLLYNHGDVRTETEPPFGSALGDSGPRGAPLLIWLLDIKAQSRLGTSFLQILELLVVGHLFLHHHDYKFWQFEAPRSWHFIACPPRKYSLVAHQTFETPRRKWHDGQPVGD